MAISPEFRTRMDDLVQNNQVVLFMKGNRRMPQCGFSARVVGILDSFLDDYQTVDVLSDHEVRTGMKDYSDWPTFPQLYVKGEFVGGCDIVTEMHGSGELHGALGIELKEVAPPNVTVTPPAAAAFKDALADAPGMSLRFTVTPRFQHGLDFGAKSSVDIVSESNGIELVMDRSSAERAEGVVIDFITGPTGSGFKIENPNAPATVKQIGPTDAKALLDGGAAVLVDVRTQREWDTARIEGAKLLASEGEAWLDGLAKDTAIVFQCHHGGRSQAAAEAWVQKGFTNVHNLAGGIDAWAREVDTSVPRY
ncbi:MAG: Grx4 family monothiol glutaredoxin [Deltaproteobacteria bacterium]|nr:Grx4 family monothiol glutaredoxin [Deltaproteobacteria bacterium]